MCGSEANSIQHFLLEYKAYDIQRALQETVPTDKWKWQDSLYCLRGLPHTSRLLQKNVVNKKI